MEVTNVETLNKKLKDMRIAQEKYASFTQEQVDKIFKAVSLAANDSRIKLAELAVKETGMGILEDKVIKNHLACEYVYNKYKDEKTCGVLEEDLSFGIQKIAEPLGIVAAIIPTTNPTSTTIFKALICLKTRNGVIFSPHPRAKNCTIETAKLILDAAVKAGAPENIIGWIDTPSIELSKLVMENSDTILATGGPGMVKAAYSSGKPAIGVGAGNTPVIIDETANIKTAVSSILLSKTFDNGVVCSSEQAIIAVEKVYNEVKKELLYRGAYLLNKKEAEKLRATMFINRSLNSDIVGQSAFKIAELAGFKVPEETKVLIGEIEKIDVHDPFVHEKISPILGLYKSTDFEDALVKADEMLQKCGGIGHTSVLYTDEFISKHRIQKFGAVMKTSRALVNTPSSHGAVGDVYNFKIEPSFTLGCGSWGGNSVTDNVGIKNLLNIKSVALRRENMLWFRVPPKIYLKYGCLPSALQDLKYMNKKRAFIVTDKVLYKLGFLKSTLKVLEELSIEYKIFYEVEPDPTLATAVKGSIEMINFQPDIIIALGGGSPMDAAKIMWLLYEHPEAEFKNLSMTFMDIRKRIYNFPPLRQKANFIAIPTSAGTGSEVTPFTVITDEKTGIKYPLADYELTPDMAIIDVELMMNMPKGLTAASGIDALTHALEAYVSVLATEYTNGLALEAIKLIFEYLPLAYEEGSINIKAREKMAYASSMAGMAFANAFLGVCHSMAHKLGSAYNIPHGIANALMITEVIKFNATDNPVKQAAFPQYEYPDAKFRYAKITDYLQLGGNNESEKVQLLISAIDDLKNKVNIPKNIKEAGVSKESFYMNIDNIAKQAFDDQCTGANPRYPLISEIKQMLINAYE